MGWNRDFIAVGGRENGMWQKDTVTTDNIDSKGEKEIRN